MISIVIGCDNAAVTLKSQIVSLLREKGNAIEDFGCYNTTDKTNYPTIAKLVCERIIASGFKKRGILVCGTGIGMAITANKFKGIRAAVCHDSYSAERSILSNNSNILCMGERVIGCELAKKIVNEWIKLHYIDSPSTPKIREIQEIEDRNFCSK